MNNAIKIENYALEDSTDICEKITITLIDKEIVYVIAFGKIIDHYEKIRSSIDHQ